MFKKILVILFTGVSFMVADSQSITKESEMKSLKGDESIFSGDVQVKMMFDSNEWRNFSGGYVEFSQGARSAWHTHPNGQTLVVVDGEIITQEWGKKPSIAKAGDIITCPPHIKHWHGATQKSHGAHIALTGAKNGNVVEWLEKVDDLQYQKALQEVKN